MTNIVTEAMMEAALDAYREGVYLTDEQVFTSVSRIVEAATLSRPAQEPVAYRAVDPDGDGHIYFDRENTLDVYRKAGVQFTPLYAAPQPVINPTHSQGAGTPGLLTDPAPADHVPCPCTLIEQDEDCTLGYPSMICGVCKGKGHTTQDQVTALACEMIKIASDVGGPEDPFAAWESISLLQSQKDQLRKALEPFAKYAGDPSHIKQRAFLQLLICPLGDEHPDNHIPHFQAARAALAASEGSALDAKERKE